MTVVSLNPQPRFNPATIVMEAVGLTAEQAPGLFRFATLYCAAEPAIATTKAGSDAQRELVMFYIGTPLKKQIGVLRLHHRPYVMFADDIGDSLYCAAASSLLPNKNVDKVYAVMTDDDRRHTGLGRGFEIGYEAMAVMNGGANGYGHNFASVSGECQLIFLLNACQFARTYIDLLNDSSALAAQFNKSADAVRKARSIRSMLSAIHEVVEGAPTSAMSDCYLSLMRTAKKLEDAKQPATLPAAQILSVEAFRAKRRPS